VCPPWRKETVSKKCRLTLPPQPGKRVAWVYSRADLKAIANRLASPEVGESRIVVGNGGLPKRLLKQLVFCTEN